MSFAARVAIVWLLTTGFLVGGGAEAGPTIGLPLILVGLMALLRWRDSRPLPPGPPPQQPVSSPWWLNDDTNPSCPFCKGSGKYEIDSLRVTECGCVKASRRAARQVRRESRRRYR
jgi:hypothetical protein